MSVHILLSGLPLTLRARLQGSLVNVKTDAIKDANQIWDKLELFEYAAVVINECSIDTDTLLFLEKLAEVYSGTVIFCAWGQRSARELRQIVHGSRVSAILHHPMDPSELLRSLAIHLGVLMRASGRQPNHTEEVLLDKIWREHQTIIGEKVQKLNQFSCASLETTRTEELEEAWKLAHTLSATLSSFQLHRATLVSREAENIISAAVDGAPLQASRLNLLTQAHRWRRRAPCRYLGRRPAQSGATIAGRAETLLTRPSTPLRRVSERRGGPRRTARTRPTPPTIGSPGPRKKLQICCLPFPPSRSAMRKPTRWG
jgi:hypothetical protein